MKNRSIWRMRAQAAVLVSASMILSATVLTACSDGAPASDEGSAADPGALRGELVAYVADFDDGTTETQYGLRADDGTETPLQFSHAPNLRAGQRIRVHGIARQDGIEVTSYSAESSGAQSEPLIGVTPVAPRRMAVFLVDLTGTGYTGPSADSVEQQFFQGPKSVNAYYAENSYGRNGLVGDVLGPFPYTMTACSNTDTRNLATAMKAMATGTYDQYGYIFTKTSLCSWSGLGAVGDPARPARDTWYNGSIGCVVTVQEPGHNYGMQHSSSMACGTATFVDAPDGTCTHSEYGDTFDPMGGGCRHMNVWQKEYQQWLGGCNAVKVTSSGTFYVLPTELACNGVQALQIPMPKSRPFTRPASGGGQAGTDTLTSYYLEYRISTGFDQGMTPTVLLHVGGDYRTQSQSGLHTWLLDMHPGGNQGFRDAGFTVGQTFTDPAGGVSITVQAMDNDKATIQVDIANGTGDPTCLDGTTLAPPGPIVCTTAPIGSGDGGVVTVDAGPPPPPRDAGSATGGTTGMATGTTGRTTTGTGTTTGGASTTTGGASTTGGRGTNTGGGATTGIGASTGGNSAGISGSGSTGATTTDGAATASGTAGASAGASSVGGGNTSSSATAGATATSATSAGGSSASGGTEGATATAGADSGNGASGTDSGSADGDSGVRGGFGCAVASRSTSSDRGRAGDRSATFAAALFALGFVRFRRRPARGPQGRGAQGRGAQGRGARAAADSFASTSS